MAGSLSALRGLLDIVVFSSLWVGAVAGLLAAATAAALGLSASPAVVGIAFAGTLLVYNVDRLRDMERDRETSPERTAFVARHRTALTWLAAAGGAGAAALALALDPTVWLLCAGVLALGLAHRRLKHLPFVKGLYIAGAWLAVVVGVPVLAAPAAPTAAAVAWASGILGAGLLANVMVSSLRDEENAAGQLGAERTLGLARGVALAGVVAAALAAPPAGALGLIPAAVLVSLLRWRPGERYGLVVVDGALGIGAAVAAIWLR